MSKKVIITGGSRGIGSAIVKKCVGEGYDVVFNYHSNSGAAERLVEELQGAGGTVRAIQADVTDFDLARKFVLEAQESFGGEVDALVNNAGITRDRNLFLMAKEEWDAVISTNLTGYFNVTRHIITYFLKNKRGTVVNISSVSGLTGLAGQTNYCASKSGIIGFTRALAKEAARAGVPVNCVAPGYIATDMVNQMNEKQFEEIKKKVPMKRLGTTDEVAELVLFLLSDKARYITGQVLTIDGGLSA